MEILAPAGNQAALERAEAAGADAVYLGYSAFSARAGAGNFDRRELEEAIRYAHLRHMRVYVTVNTLVKDDELPEVADVLRMLRDLKADAVLVQDLGVLRIARRLFPDLVIHASTQMAVHNRTGVEWCAKQGIRRVVLARECSLDEIRRCAETGTEIEVFAHGAQCVAVSGLCLFSSMLGERSGNRGRCAQPCRMEYIFRGKRGAWLSPRDVCLRDELPKLQEAGVASLKIEGRLKRPEYVAVVTDSYRKGLDSLNRCRFRTADGEETEALLQIFNRGGFMKGYALGCEDAGVIESGWVNHRGVRIGRIAAADGKIVRLVLEKDLHTGDGLAVRGKHEEITLSYFGAEMKAGETALLRLRPGTKANAGDEVYRLTDMKQLAAAGALKSRTIPVDFYLRAMPGEALRLTATDGESWVTVTGGTVTAAKTRAAAAEELVRNLKKTGETAFVPGMVQAETEGAFVPVSAVNAIRREALEKLAEVRIKAFEDNISAEGEYPEEKRRAADLPAVAYVRKTGQADAARAAGMRVVFCPEDYRKEALQALKAKWIRGDWLALPDVCGEDTLRMLLSFAEEMRDVLGGIVLGSVGQLGAAWPVPVGAGPAVPVMNRQAASLLFEAGCVFVTASPELTGQELKALIKDEPAMMVTVYGRTRLMLLHHCPARTALGLKRGHRDCRMCDDHHPEALKDQVLEDRKGYRFPLLRQRLPEGCLVELMNAFPTDNLDKDIPNRSMILTTETPDETQNVLKAFTEHCRTEGETTSGHWKRAVE